MVKNREHVLPLKKGIKVYIPKRHIRSYLNFMSMPTGDQTVIPMAKQAAASYFHITEDPRTVGIKESGTRRQMRKILI